MTAGTGIEGVAGAAVSTRTRTANARARSTQFAGQRLRIEGRGPVAIALRLFLARQGFSAEAIAHEVFAERVPDWLAARALALSLGSTHLLSRIVALPASAPIRTVDVSIAHRAGRTRFHARELDSPTLGCVVRYEALHRALFDALVRLGECAPRGPAGDDRADDAAALVVVADGEPRSAAPRARDWRVHDFGQSALLAEIVVEHDVPGTAFEHFTSEGPLALLPLPESHRRALVWCASPQRTAARAQMSTAAFEAELRRAFGGALGALRLDSARHQAPLHRQVAPRGDDPRRVAIGNAAQTLHPVAGQGLNLGLRDAFELAQRLGDARARGRRLDAAVERFRRARLIDRAATVGVTDALARLFTFASLAPIESIAFDLLDLAAPVRNRFATALMFGLRSG